MSIDEHNPPAVRSTVWSLGHRLFLHVLLIVGAVAMLYPLLWMVVSSLKPESQIFTDIGLWPKEFVFENWAQWFRQGATPPFGRLFLNSFLVAAGAITGNLISCSMAAYAFARLGFKFRRFWFTAMMMTIMLPSQVTLVPQYVLFHRLGWVNTFLPLIAPKFLAVDAFFVFLMVQFIRGLPVELSEAARVDGCRPSEVYWHIMLPLMTPALATTAVFTFIWTWDDFLGQLIYLNDPDTYTVPLGLRSLVDISGEGGPTTWGPLLAMTTLSVVPAFVLFLVFQRYLIEGIATTGLKG